MAVNDKPVADDVISFWRDYEATARTGKKATIAAEALGVAAAPQPPHLVSAWEMITPHVSPDYVFVDPFGFPTGKAHLQSLIQSGTGVFTDYERTEHDVRVHGDTAIYVSLVTLKGQRAGEDVSGQYRETHVLLKRDHGWVVVASQMTKLDPGHAMQHPFAEAKP
jgi:ketosteroid isomerase-like protein